MFIIDTHILIWFVNGSQSLSMNAQEKIEQCIKDGGEILISSISIWEISMLVNKGRLLLNMDLEIWLRHVQNIKGFRFISIDNDIGYKSTILPGEFHKDPADRMIVATARKYAIPLITADEKIQNYEHVQTFF